jgi:hypothetical protein
MVIIDSIVANSSLYFGLDSGVDLSTVSFNNLIALPLYIIASPSHLSSPSPLDRQSFAK